MKLSDFEGRWEFTRTIDDSMGAGRSLAVGYAEIYKGIYQETSTLTLPNGTKLKATQRYLWADCDTGIAVCFADGRPFHTICFESPSDTHICPPDIYRVSYTFDVFPNWESDWLVNGPRKKYRAITNFRQKTACTFGVPRVK